MQVEYVSEQPVTSGAAQAATGRNLETWYAELDALGGPSAGRKGLTDYLFKEKKVNPWWAVTIAVEFEKLRGAKEKDGFARGYGICVTKSVTATPQQVYDALLDARTWLGAGSQADAREGGAFQDAHGHHGVFKKLNPGKVLRFTWQGDRHPGAELVEIKLTASGAKTGLVLTHERLQTRESADGMRAAWGQVLESLKRIAG